MKHSKYLLAAPAVPITLALTACGGGSGGPGGPGGSTTFLGFTEIKPNSTVKIQGTDAAGEPVTAQTKYDKGGDLEAVTVTTKDGPMTWNTSNSEENVDAPADLMIADRKDGSSSVAT